MQLGNHNSYEIAIRFLSYEKVNFIILGYDKMSDENFQTPSIGIAY